MRPDALRDLIAWAEQYRMRIRSIDEHRTWLSKGFDIEVRLWEDDRAVHNRRD